MNNLIVEQKITALANQYRVFSADDNGDKQQLVAFAHQKRFAFKEEVLFYSDEAKTNLAFKVKAEKTLDVHGKFIVSDTDGTTLGSMRKVFKSSLWRSTWEMFNQSDARVCLVRESSLPLAIARRVWGWLPYIGDLPFFLRYHFEFAAPDTDAILATYHKTTLWRDHYRLQIVDQTLTSSLPWQVIAAQAVLLDALQGR